MTEQKNRQFVKVYNDLLEQGLTLEEAYVYSLLKDRMCSSLTRVDFFDKEQDDFYVIFTNQEISEKIHKSVRTVSKIMTSLAKKKFIERKQQFNKPNKIFLVKNNTDLKENNEVISNEAKVNEINVKEKSSSPYVQNLRTNQTDINQTDINTNDTYDTDKINQNNKFKEHELNRSFKSMIEHFNVPEKVVNTFDKYSNSECDFYEFRRLLFQAKKAVLKEVVNPDPLTTTFESNQELCNDLSKNINLIVLGSFNKAQNNMNRAKGLIFGSLKKVFERNFKTSYAETDTVNIPITSLVE